MRCLSLVLSRMSLPARASALVLGLILLSGCLGEGWVPASSPLSGHLVSPVETRKPPVPLTDAVKGEVAQSPLPTLTETAMPVPTPVLASTPTPSPTPMPTSPLHIVSGPLPPGPKVVCADNGDKDLTSAIWMANVDDLREVQVIATLANERERQLPEAHLSPDGRAIAYVMPGWLQPSVLGVVGTDGSDRRILDESVAEPGGEWQVRWSRDSQWIAYVRDVRSGREHVSSEIWVVRADGSEKRHIASAEYALLVGWSRDSSQVYYTPGGNDLWAVDVAGGAPPSVLLHLGSGGVPLRLSPDGAKIVYEAHTSVSSPVTLGVRSLDGRTDYVLAEGIDARDLAFSNYTLSPVWSVDSQRVVYSRPVDGTSVALLSVRWDDPEDVIALRAGDAAYYRPLSWSPDGRRLASWRYALDEGNEAAFNLVLIDPDGRMERVYSLDPALPMPSFVGWMGE
jgi:Tol biopolymer transport system component